MKPTPKTIQLAEEAIEYFSDMFETEYPKVLFNNTTFIKLAIHLYEEKLKVCPEIIISVVKHVQLNLKYIQIEKVIEYLKTLI